MGALAALIPLITTIAPHLIPMLATPAVGTILSQAADAAMKVFGTKDANQIQLMIEQDKNKLEEYKAELEAQTAETVAQMQDLQSARNQTIQLAQAGSYIAWGAPIVSIIIVFGFFTMMAVVFFNKIDPNNLLIGAMIAAFAAVYQYWLGSSPGSKSKDNLIAQMASNTTSNAVQTVTNAAKKMFK